MITGPAMPQRLVLVLTPGGASAPAVAEALSLARCLQLPIRALLVEDVRVLAAAGHPFSCEIGSVHGPLRSIDVACVDRDYGIVARRLETQLRTAAGGLPFELVRARGVPERLLDTSLAAGDLATFFQPAGPFDRVFAALRAGRRTQGRWSMDLELPSSLTAASGCIAVLAAGAEDRATIEFGAALAQRAARPFEVWLPPAAPAALAGTGVLARTLRRVDLPSDRVTIAERLRATVRMLVIAPTVGQATQERLVDLATRSRTAMLTVRRGAG